MRYDGGNNTANGVGDVAFVAFSARQYRSRVNTECYIFWRIKNLSIVLHL